MFIQSAMTNKLINLNAFDNIQFESIDGHVGTFGITELGEIMYGFYSGSRKIEFLGITTEPELVYDYIIAKERSQLHLWLDNAYHFFAKLFDFVIWDP